MQFETMSQLGDTLKGVVHISEGAVQVLDAKQLRGFLLDRLIWTAVFHPKMEMRAMARWIIKMAGPSFGLCLGVVLQQPEKGVGAERCQLPIIHLQGLSYDVARTILRVATRYQGLPFVLEHRASKDAKIRQSPSEYIAVIVAAAIREGYRGPLFLKETLLPPKAIEKSKASTAEESTAVFLKHVKAAISTGFFYIDLDISLLNKEEAAYLSMEIQSFAPPGVPIFLCETDKKTENEGLKYANWALSLGFRFQGRRKLCVEIQRSPEHPSREAGIIEIGLSPQDAMEGHSPKEVLWRLPVGVRGSICGIVSENTQAFFKKAAPNRKPFSIDDLCTTVPFSFALRDEIAAAALESGSDQGAPLFVSV
ncbi:MAG: hypothetical protein ACE5GK_07075 [Nitrospiria bacterium]